MNTPNLFLGRVVDNDGKLTSEAQNWFSRLVQELQGNLSDEGFQIPNQTTENITELSAADKKGTLLYDSDTNELKANINGTYKVVTVT